MSRFSFMATLLISAILLPTAGFADEAATLPAAPLQPTQHGLRLTPSIARGMSRLAIQHNLTGELGLSDAQVDALSDSSARHLMEMGHAQGQAIEGMLEYAFQSMLTSQGRLDPDTAREFAQHTLPIMPAYHRMLDEFAQDAEEILTESQVSGFQEWMKSYRDEVHAFETRMNRWEAGNAQEGENPFAPSPVAEERAGRFGDHSAPTRRVQRARTHAQWEMRRLGPGQWKQFLAHAQRYFHFTEEQAASANALLDQYSERCRALMTEEWRARLEKNRILDRMKWSMRDLARGPWAYHIDREYEELVLPIDQLGNAFRRDVLALLNGEQRDNALRELREKAERHGMDQETRSAMESILMSIAPAATQASGPMENRGS